jgi:hypothetical protein
MSSNFGFDDLTYRGLMLLRRFGNGSPTLSQMEFAQKIVALICEENNENAIKLDALFSQNSQSREDIIRDNKHYRNNIESYINL